MEDILKSDFNILNTPGADRTKTSSRDTGDLVGMLSNQKLHFRALSFDVILQLLTERQALRDKNRARILGEITDVSSDVSCCDGTRYFLEPREHEEKRIALLKHKADLESALREEDVSLWQDTEELRRIIVDAGKNLESAKLRAGLFRATIDDGDKGTNDPENSGHL